MFRIWDYYTLHIPTGRILKGKTSAEYTKVEFLTLLNQWSRQRPEIWQYWTDQVNWMEERTSVR